MSIRPADAVLRRRTVLQLFMSTGVGLSLAACGGGSDAPQQDAAASLRTQADAAIASGLVGLAAGLVTSQSSSVVVAGKRRQGEGAPVDPQDRFAIGSNTKAMTSAAIVALAERGGPALSLTLPQVFPAWAAEIHPAYAQVTLTDLLHHRGGLPAFNGSGPEDDAFLAVVGADTGSLPSTTTDRRAYFARWVLAQPPVTGVTPGRDFHYSNAGYAVAAALVEARTGRVFDAMFEEVLAQPLGLQGTWRSQVPGDRDTVWGQEGPPDALSVVEATAETRAAKGWLDALAPAGNWACSGAEYMQWLRWHVLALRGERAPLPQAYVRDLRAASDSRYVWGWQTATTPNRVLLTHTGHVPGFMAEAVVDRAGDFATFGLSNTGYVADDGSSWVLKRIDQALADVLKQQSSSI